MKLPDMTISGKELLVMNQALVYGWKRDGKYLYIGSSLRGYGRLFQHHAIAFDEILQTDTFEFWYSSAETIRIDEAQLIKEHRPRLNKTFNKQDSDNMLCDECRKHYILLAPGQRFCSRICKNDWHNRRAMKFIREGKAKESLS